MSVVHEIRSAGLSDRVVLRDGSIVDLRPLRGDDEPALRPCLEGVSPESLRRRFCGAIDLACAATSLVRDCGPDDTAPVVGAGSSPEIVAHAALFRLGTGRAEVAFLVTDEWQGRSLGSLLLSRLARAAEPKLTFALPFDLNAWAPAHNSVYSQDITGDPAKDLVGNRTKRFFLESGALTRASRMELGVDLPGEILTRAQISAAGAQLREPARGHRSFLVQTYARDTGAVLTTLSVPLYVHGQRFGCVCLGWDPERLRA